MRPLLIALRRAGLATGVVLIFSVWPVAAAAQDPPGPNEPFDFAVSREWLESLRAQKTFLPRFKITLLHRSDIKSLAQDCEVHLAGRLVDLTFGDPQAVVVEPPNLCKFLPGAANPTTQTTKPQWRALLDKRVIGKTCDVEGFPRIYTEHAEGGSTGGSNPNHVFEIHPATRISCPGSSSIDFTGFLRAFSGLRHIQPASAHECLTTLRLWVRYHNADDEDHYEFFQDRSPRCGNFAIVEIGSLPREWIQSTAGGHTAIGRVTANGHDRLTLKLYAVTGTATDDWFARLKKGQQNLDDPRLVHGILTYDYFAILRTLEQNGQLSRSTEWLQVRFPLALVILGPTTVVPWDPQ